MNEIRIRFILKVSSEVAREFKIAVYEHGGIPP